MSCRTCNNFHGDPCPCCRTLLRLKFLITQGILPQEHEAKVLGVLRQAGWVCFVGKPQTPAFQLGWVLTFWWARAVYSYALGTIEVRKRKYANTLLRRSLCLRPRGYADRCVHADTYANTLLRRLLRLFCCFVGTPTAAPSAVALLRRYSDQVSRRCVYADTLFRGSKILTRLRHCCPWLR